MKYMLQIRFNGAQAGLAKLSEAQQQAVFAEDAALARRRASSTETSSSQPTPPRSWQFRRPNPTNANSAAVTLRSPRDRGLGQRRRRASGAAPGSVPSRSHGRRARHRAGPSASR
jgi:hypothetical protein